MNGTQNMEVVKREGAVLVGFDTAAGFELMQRQAKMLSESQLVPSSFQGKVADCCIALEMANRIGASPFQVIQNIYIVHGKPTWSAQFLVSCVNACGRFSPIRYRTTGEKGTDSWGCIAWAKDLEDGEVLESPEITIQIAKDEGWFQKKGSKWQTMPELMLRYRAATFFARTYAPDVTMGMMTREEVKEMPAMDITASPSPIESGELLSGEPEPSAEQAKPKPKADIDADKLPAAALPAAINTHKEKPYFSGIMGKYNNEKPNKLDEKDQRECLAAMLDAQSNEELGLEG